MNDFVQALHSGRVLLMDGAMGTELWRAGVDPMACFEGLNLTRPELVRALHYAYVQAGAKVLLTNTFQANPERLAKHGIRESCADVCRAAVELARAAGGQYVLVAMGPTKVFSREHATSVLAGCGDADGLLLETQSDPGVVAAWAELQGGVPIFASFSFCRAMKDELRTFQNVMPEVCAERAQRSGAVAVGVNCGREIGRVELVEILRRYRSETHLPLFVRANGGSPPLSGGFWEPETPAGMAAWVPDFLDAGASIIGGCCGTTPLHIAAFRGVVDEWNSRRC